MNKKTRESGIELLKIICMIMIVLSHSIPKYGAQMYPASHINLLQPTYDIQTLVISFFNYLGQMANGPFIICTAYFLLDSHTVKGKKVWNMILDTFLFSVGFLAVGILLNVPLTKAEILRQFMPLTNEFNWFIGCYVLLYLIHPFLNTIIEKMAQKQLLSANLVALFLYSGIGFLLENKYHYTVFVGFVIYYFVAAYIKKYMSKFSENVKLNVWLLILSVVCIIIQIVLTNHLGFHMDVLKNQMCRWCKFINPFIILFAITSFNIFKGMKFQNKLINTVASVSLLVYIIHENYIFFTYGKPVFFDYVYRTYGYDYITLWCLFFTVICFVGSLLIALVYKFTLQKLVEKISGVIARRGKSIADKVLDKIMKI